jgi:ribosomal protein L37AE/L43A
MSFALDYAMETLAKLLPEDRLKVLHSVVRYCWECGRVGLKNPATLRWECRHCGRDWIVGTWVDGYRRIR